MFERDKYLNDRSLVLENDESRMNWVGNHGKPLGTIAVPDENLPVKKPTLKTEVTSEFLPDGAICETYRFTNPDKTPLFIQQGSLGIYVPFNDDYIKADDCIQGRCYAHVFCGGNITWIMGLRMNGNGRNVGMVLTKGSISKYSVEREIEAGSPDRGDIILHPDIKQIGAGETVEVQWVFFEFNRQEDFFAAAGRYSRTFIEVRANHCVLFAGEKLRLEIKTNFQCGKLSLCDGTRSCELTPSNGVFTFEKTVDEIGEHNYLISAGAVKTRATVLIQPPLEDLVDARCRFIFEKQQFLKENDPLDGAFLIYDNEEKCQYYNEAYDHNAARERVGMGALVARWLHANPNPKYDVLFKRYLAFLKREIVDTETGWVYDDVLHNNRWIRLFNFPWTAQAFLEIYRYTGDKEDLLTAARILRCFFGKGEPMKLLIEAAKRDNQSWKSLDYLEFCAHVLPVREMLNELTVAGEKELAGELKECYLAYGDFHVRLGEGVRDCTEVAYDPHAEACYARILMEDFLISGDMKYKNAAEIHYRRMQAACSRITPDWRNSHVMETFWDDRYFGKRFMFGDVTPHYWTVLVGDAQMSCFDATGDKMRLERGLESFRSTCGLVFPDGSASCAYVMPFKINGARGEFFDPWANDQDWGIYFMYKFSRRPL